jgi:hypothetical protein
MLHSKFFNLPMNREDDESDEDEEDAGSTESDMKGAKYERDEVGPISRCNCRFRILIHLVTYSIV